MSRRHRVPEEVQLEASGHHPLVTGDQVWRADFMDWNVDHNPDRRSWPKVRHLTVETVVRKGEIPNVVVFAIAQEHLGWPASDNLERVS